MLVVDDNATNRRILEEMLASWRMKPTAVADAERRWRRAAPCRQAPASRFDVVIPDGQMPDVDGFMLARRIRARPAIRATPIVMLTSVGMATDPAPAAALASTRT